jgi:N-acyl-D-amino-acid deacylase
VACLVPNGNLRLDTIGWSARPATDDEMGTMKTALHEALEQGAIGLSSGLDYIPSRSASTTELTQLCEVVRQVGGVYVTHMRGYDARSATGFAEVAEIAHKSTVRVHVSHLMGRTDRHLPVVDRLVADGVDLTFDSYPYLAGCSTLGMLGLPPALQQHPPEVTLRILADPDTAATLRRDWYPQEGDRVRAYRLSSIAAQAMRALEGQTVADACAATDLDLADLVCKLLVDSQLAVSVIEPNGLDEADLRAHHRHNLHMAGSDGVYTGGSPHPRGWGTFARYLGRYTRDLADLTWPEAVRHLATAPAERFGLKDRGRIAPGQHGDVVVIDPEAIRDTATFEHPRSLAAGVIHVLVNGVAVLIDNQPTGARPGQAIRRGA